MENARCLVVMRNALSRDTFLCTLSSSADLSAPLSETQMHWKIEEALAAKFKNLRFAAFAGHSDQEPCGH